MNNNINTTINNADFYSDNIKIPLIAGAVAASAISASTKAGRELIGQFLGTRIDFLSKGPKFAGELTSKAIFLALTVLAGAACMYGVEDTRKFFENAAALNLGKPLNVPSENAEELLHYLAFAAAISLASHATGRSLAYMGALLTEKSQMQPNSKAPSLTHPFSSNFSIQKMIALSIKEGGNLIGREVGKNLQFVGEGAKSGAELAQRGVFLTLAALATGWCVFRVENTRKIFEKSAILTMGKPINIPIDRASELLSLLAYTGAASHVVHTAGTLLTYAGSLVLEKSGGKLETSKKVTPTDTASPPIMFKSPGQNPIINRHDTSTATDESNDEISDLTRIPRDNSSYSDFTDSQRSIDSQSPSPTPPSSLNSDSSYSDSDQLSPDSQKSESD